MHIHPDAKRENKKKYTEFYKLVGSRKNMINKVDRWCDKWRKYLKPVLNINAFDKEPLEIAEHFHSFNKNIY